MNRSKTLTLLIISFLFFLSTIQAQSLLWEISGNGLEESSYLFGTVHLSDKRVFNFNDSVFAKINECDAFTMEIEATPENTTTLGNSIYLDDGQTIDKVLSEKEYAYLKKFFKETFDLNLDGLKIFTPMSIVSMATMKLFKSDMDTYVDNFLYQYAKSKNKKTFSVEPVQLQIDLLKNVPAEYLLDVANEWDTYQGMSDKIVNAYAKEDMDALIEIMFSDSGFKKMEDAFIWDRNKTMADSIDLFVNRQSTFIAIGTGHLPLEGGVIDLLRKKGFEVNPIIAPKTIALPEISKNGSWVTLAPDESGFSIDLPNQPESQEMDKVSEIGILNIKFYISEMPAEDENLAYGIAITDYPIEKINSETMTKAELDEYYDKSLRGATTGVKGKIINRGEMKLDNFVAKTADFSAYNGLATIKYVALLRKNRLFLLQVITKGNIEKNAGLKKFFNSFKLEHYDLEKTTLTKLPSKEWETLISEEGNFSISMLGKTTGRRNASEGEAPKNTDPLYYMSENFDEDGNELFLFAQFENFPPEDHSDSISTEVLMTFYDNIFLGIVGNDKERILSQKTFKINGYLAQRGEYLIPDDGNDICVNAIAFWYKTRYYFIQHGTVGKKLTEREINKFLNSFKILDD